jgi:HflK protein
MRFFRRGRITSVLWASALGAPLPLCSCGVVPAALGLSRQGATTGATVSFLISTPETGIDSIALSYALTDPLMTVFRPVAAFTTAVVAGIATNLFGRPRPAVAAGGGTDGEAATLPMPEAGTTLVDLHAAAGPAIAGGRAARTRRVFSYAFRELLDETAHWLVLGIVVAAFVAVLLPPSVIERYLSGGLVTMLAMLAIGIPLYTCASASTPVAAALVLKGLSPGAALVFLLSGPATNLGTIVMLLKFLGPRVVAIYLAAIAGVSLLAGYALDWVYRTWQVSPVVTFGQAAGVVPEPLKLAGAVVLSALLAASLWRTPVPIEWLKVRDAVGTLTGVRLTGGRLRTAAAVALGALYLGSGFFTVQPGEVGLRSRFGRLVATDLGPGLHYRLPWPIEGHRIVQRDRIRRIEVGFRSPRPARPSEFAAILERPGPVSAAPGAAPTSFWSQRQKLAEESLLLMGDENIIDIGFTAQYRVRDAVAFAYNIADPDEIVRSVTISVLRAILATMTVDAIYTSGRLAVEQRVVGAGQELLDAYRTGIRLVAVSLLSVHAPEDVHAAFRDVASAQEDKVHVVERAATFAQESVNLAEGEAAAMVEAALAFKEQKILEAEGDALAFRLREREYRRAPELTRLRLHLEALEDVLPGAHKILRPGAGDLKELDLWLIQPFGPRKAP